MKSYEKGCVPFALNMSETLPQAGETLLSICSKEMRFNI